MTQLNFARHRTSGQISQNLFILAKFRYYKTCLQILQNMSEVPVQDFFEIASHKVTLARHNLRVHLQSKCVQIQSILIKCESQGLHNVPEQPSKDLWACKIIKRGQSIFTKYWSQERLFARHINRENAPTTFLSILQAESLQNGSELHSKTASFLDTQIVKICPEISL